MNALQEEDTSPMTTAESTSTDTSHDEESDDIWDAQLNDDVLGCILRLKKQTSRQKKQHWQGWVMKHVRCTSNGHN